MKKLILLCLLVTGCGNYELLNTCTDLEEADTLKVLTTYEIKFDDNDVYETIITIDYTDSDEDNIEIIKRALSTEPEYLQDNRINLINTSTQIKYQYIIKDDSEEKLQEHFDYDNNRSGYIKLLKEEGFSCK